MDALERKPQESILIALQGREEESVYLAIQKLSERDSEERLKLLALEVGLSTEGEKGSRILVLGLNKWNPEAVQKRALESLRTRQDMEAMLAIGSYTTSLLH